MRNLARISRIIVVADLASCCLVSLSSQEAFILVYFDYRITRIWKTMTVDFNGERARGSSVAQVKPFTCVVFSGVIFLFHGRTKSPVSLYTLISK